ncbi:hypothetical protein SDC9_82290 [bioreactor metagenome]|uniref:Uncharacterized protein n=1 Tax=bioreactor metagenome TaxID=1076179 RepID=A0A644Z514_9ZZZZ
MRAQRVSENRKLLPLISETLPCKGTPCPKTSSSSRHMVNVSDEIDTDEGSLVLHTIETELSSRGSSKVRSTTLLEIASY